DQRGPHQPAPERARGRVLAAPRQHDRLYLGVAAAVVADDPAPRTHRSAEPERQLGELSDLAFGRGDLADRIVLLQYEVGEDAIVIERLVVGRVEAPKVIQLPRLAGEPGGDPGLDGAEVDADQLAPRVRAQRRARQLADDLERVAVARQLGVVAGDDRVDQGGRQLGVI